MQPVECDLSIAEIAGITGDSSARFVYQAQPAKFAAMEGLYVSQRGAPITIGGIPSDSEHRVLYGIQIPHGLSWLATFDLNAPVRGLDSFPPDQRPNPAASDSGDLGWTGDVRYHLGGRRSGAVLQVSLTLAPNPSHLEFVNPVVEGKDGDLRVVRGGDWGMTATDCRSSARSRRLHSNPATDIGFRCAVPASR